MNVEVKEALYTAFAPDDQSIWRSLRLSNPLEELVWEDLEELEDKSLLYDADALKYVLPRWLELLTDSKPSTWTLGEETLGFMLVQSQWLQWSPAQVESIRQVFHTWGEKHLREGTMEEFADVIADLEEDVASFLDTWVRVRPLEVARWIWKTSWIRPSPLRRWVTSPRVENKLEEVFFRNPDGEHAPLLSNAIQLIRALRALEDKKVA